MKQKRKIKIVELTKQVSTVFIERVVYYNLKIKKRKL